jgi:uncharacterized repeat protein (TIGR03943 family)
MINNVSQPHSPDRGLIIAKAVLLFGLSGYFVVTIVTGNLNNYINSARVAWLIYVAVVLFAVLGAAALLDLRRVMPSHSRVGLPSVILMALPLVLGTLIPSRPLGAEAASGSIRVGASSYGSANVALVTKDPRDRDVLDWSRLFVGEDSPSVFNGQSARVLGFIYKEPSYPDGMFMVGRFTLSCCVADASALGIPAFYDSAADFDAGTWVEVEGTFRAQAFLGQQMPVLQVAKITLTDEPDEPYLYP